MSNIQNFYKKDNLFWLFLILLSLSISGFYSIFVSMMRIPFIFKFFHHPDFFKISLVIHVTLSINIFFILFIFFIWSEDLKNQPFIIFIVKIISFFSILLITVSGFAKNSIPLTINYIPVINNLFFIFGLSIFFINFFVFSIVYFYFSILNNLRKIFSDLRIHLNFFIFFSVFVAFLCFFSYILKLKIENSSFDLEEFFWGFGHVIQFSFVELSLLCIYINFTQNFSLLKIEVNKKFLYVLSLLKFIILLSSPFFYFSYEGGFLEFFTLQMKYGLVIFLVPINLYILFQLFKQKVIFEKFFNYTVLAFVCSGFLGLFGGKIAYFIKEVNVTIPAHYHGSLISLTIIVISFFYGIIEKKSNKNFRKKFKKIINTEIILYTIGHFGHILGLILMGGYGALRKTPGDISLDQSLYIKFAKYIFFSGSLLSIIGGFLFIVTGSYLLFKFKKYNNFY